MSDKATPASQGPPGQHDGSASKDVTAKDASRERSRASRLHYLISPRLWLQRIVFWGGAIAVAAAAILFAIGAEYADLLFHHAIERSQWLALIICPVGMALVVAATRYFPGAQGSGIPQTIAALSIFDIAGRSKLLSLRIAASKIVLTLLGLASGASIGREGPTIQIGAAIMHSVGRFAKFSRADLDRGLILAGGAAGISAAFNTPLAGIVFAIEEMSRSFEERTSGTILTAVIVAGVASLAVLGDYAYFGRTSASLGFGEGWIAVAVCGVAGGLAGGLFSHLLIIASKSLPGRIGKLASAHPVMFGAACGLALALIGLASGNATYGTGYHVARQVVEGSADAPWSFGLLKLVATLISYVSGIPGGIFAPSLAIGAGLGANLAALTPYAPAAAVALLGMVAYLAGVVQAPITAFVIVMEMTDNHDMVLPLMATALIATAISRLVCHDALYRVLAQRFLPATAAKSQAPRTQAPKTEAPQAQAPRTQDPAAKS
jgi:H+/Cl- antiporter ClcA